MEQDKLDKILKALSEKPLYQGDTDPTRVQQQVAKYKKNLKSRQERLLKKLQADHKLLESKYQDQQKLLLGFMQKEQGPVKAVEEIKQQMEPLRNITTSTAKQYDPSITYESRQDNEKQMFNALMQYNIAKWGDINSFKEKYSKLEDEANTLAKQLNLPKPNSLTLRILMALDDWKDIASYAIAKVKEHGPGILDHLLRTFAPSQVYQIAKELMGNQLQSLQSNALLPAQNSNLFAIQKDNVAQPLNLSEGVDCYSLAASISPESCKYRITSLYPRKTALLTGTTNITMRTNATGNSGLVFQPYNSVFAQTYQADNFDPVTGTGTAVSINSPVKDNETSIMYWKGSSFSITYTSTLSQNQNASVYLCYSDEMATPPLKLFPLQSSYISVNGYQNFRFSLPYTQTTDTYQVSTSGISSLPSITIYVVGGPANTNAGTVAINYIYEFTPTAAQATLIQISYPNPGPKTIELLRQLQVIFPELAMLTQLQSQNLGFYLVRQGQLSYQETVNSIRQFLDDNQVNLHLSNVPIITDSIKNDEHSFDFQKDQLD